MVCGSCGSIDLVRRRSSTVDKLVRLFSNRKRVICRRCGWSARMRWDHPDDYVPTMARLRAIDPPERTIEPAAKFEEEFDINKFH